MSKLLTTLFLCFVTTSIVNPILAKNTVSRAVSDPLIAVESDYQSGKLTIDEKVSLVLKAIKQPDALPLRYQIAGDGLQRIHSRAATPAIIDIKNHWDELSLETKAEATAALARPTGSLTYVSPSGFFRMHYDTTGPDAVSSIDLNSNGVPDYVEVNAEYCDTSLITHLSLGYLTPPSDGGIGGDTLFDVYFEEMPYYGYAVPEGAAGQPWNDSYSYLVVHRDFIGFPPNNDPEGNIAGAAKATAAHEFHHSVQFAYDAGESIWWMEADATYAEDIIFNNSDDNYNYIGSYMNSPEVSLMSTSLHMYASFIWPLYLSEKFDTSLLVSVWEGARYETIYNSITDSLTGLYGWSQDSAFADFIMWTFFTGSRDDGLHFEEALSYPLMTTAQTYTNYPQNGRVPPVNPEGYASSFIRLEPGVSQGNLRMQFTGQFGYQWAAWVVQQSSGGQYTVNKMAMSPSMDGSFDIYSFDTLTAVYLIGVNLSEFQGPASFTFNLSLFGDYAVSSQVMTTDSVVYAGAQRDFRYRVFNTSGLNDVFEVTYWDDSGWVTLDSVDRFVLSGDSSDFLIPVIAPAGIALNSYSTVHFKSVSKSDQIISDQKSAPAFTILQYGDVDFNGPVDIGDLTYLINFLFQQGTPPLPVEESGNFDCIGSIDIGDLTSMIRYLFVSGANSPCNPL